MKCIVWRDLLSRTFLVCVFLACFCRFDALDGHISFSHTHVKIFRDDDYTYYFHIESFSVYIINWMFVIRRRLRVIYCSSNAWLAWNISLANRWIYDLWLNQHFYFHHTIMQMTKYQINGITAMPSRIANAFAIVLFDSVCLNILIRMKFQLKCERTVYSIFPFWNIGFVDCHYENEI